MTPGKTASKPILVYAIILIVSLVVSGSSFLDRIDLIMLDSQFQVLRSMDTKEPDIEIIIVGIDEASYKQYQEPLVLWHPYFGQFLDAMRVANARAVGIDMVLPDRSFQFLKPGYDIQLLQSIRAIRGKVPIVLAQTLTNDGELRPLFPPIISFAGKESIGVPLVKPDIDGKVRRVFPELRSSKTTLPTFTGRLAGQLQLQAEPGLINYAIGKPFEYISMHKVIKWQNDGAQEQLRKNFENKVVLLGAVLPFEDRHRLPVGLAAWEPGVTNVPGVLIHAQALRTMVHGGSIQQASLLPVLLLVVLVSLVWWIRQPATRGALIVVVSALVVLFISMYALNNGWYIPVASVLFALILAWVSRLVVDAVATAVERKRLNQSFGGYVSPNVMTEIIAGNIHPSMKGERTRACVLFSDIRNFTGRSENEAPENIIELLNEYFDEMTKIVHDNGGTVDKFIGDGLMAFFGAPNEMSTPSDDAFRAAKKMLESLEGLNRRFVDKGFEPIAIGIGLHVGDVVVGHVGSRSRHEYTVIGDTVNSTARLEGLTKGLGYPLLVSVATAEELGYPEELVSLGEQAVKGRAAIEVYGWKPAE